MARTQVSLTGRGVGKTPKDVVLWMARKPALRPLAQYFSGMIQTLIRSTEGGGVYLLGRFYPLGVPQYFPLVYLMKEPAALHVLSLLAMFIAVLGVIGALRGKRGKLCDRLREHFAVLAMLLVVAAYWVFSIRSHLNIGIRHMMPVLPFTFVLVGTALARCRQAIPASLPRNLFLAAVIALLGWQAVSVLRVQPYHMAYFNEFAGGAENGWQRVIDSNADWGQDLGRVARFAEDKHISKLWLDYFGSADANRYLPGQWEAINLCSPPQKGWIAVSVMSYQNSASNPACDYRRWLPLEKLTTKVGYSTLIFYIE
jgi:hypothetical protein